MASRELTEAPSTTLENSKRRLQRAPNPNDNGFIQFSLRHAPHVPAFLFLLSLHLLLALLTTLRRRGMANAVSQSFCSLLRATPASGTHFTSWIAPHCRGPWAVMNPAWASPKFPTRPKKATRTAKMARYASKPARYSSKAVQDRESFLHGTFDTIASSSASSPSSLSSSPVVVSRRRGRHRRRLRSSSSSSFAKVSCIKLLMQSRRRRRRRRSSSALSSSSSFVRRHRRSRKFHP